MPSGGSSADLHWVPPQDVGGPEIYRSLLTQTFRRPPPNLRLELAGAFKYGRIAFVRRPRAAAWRAPTRPRCKRPQLKCYALGGGYMISDKASNWVDRGEPPEPTLRRVLASYRHLDPETRGAELQEYATQIRGMAEADATEIQIAGYLRSREEQHGVSHESRHRRAVAIALWHITKSAEVRDRASQLLRDSGSVATSSEVPLSAWLAERLLRGEPPKKGT